MGGRFLDYVAQGAAADRPLAADMPARIAVGAAAIFYAYDTDVFSFFNSDSVAWVELDIGALGTPQFQTLGDVDWSTPPTDGQLFTWDLAAGKFVPNDFPATIVWGGLTGDITDQADLQTALASKLDFTIPDVGYKQFNADQGYQVFNDANDKFAAFFMDDTDTGGYVSAGFVDGSFGFTIGLVNAHGRYGITTFNGAGFEFDDDPYVGTNVIFHAGNLDVDTLADARIALANLAALADVAATAPADGDVLTWDNGSSLWTPAAPTGGGSAEWWAGNVPLAADFIYHDSGDATLATATDDAIDGLRIDFGNPPVGGKFRTIGKALPSAGAADWEVTVRMHSWLFNVTSDTGLVAYNSVTKQYVSNCLEDNANDILLRASRGSLTAFGAQIVGGPRTGMGPIWFRMGFVNSTGLYRFCYSMNGRDFTVPTTMAKATAFTAVVADRVGFINIAGGGSTAGNAAYCDYWDQSW